MSITKSKDSSYYYLQVAKKLSNCNNKEWDKLSKVDRDNFEKLARSKEYELLVNL
jgi:hypothetical protein|tara:strand:+ start:9380 stop:9544 length:165 start_codon:yes stop_codon:yes gene_type:complete